MKSSKQRSRIHVFGIMTIVLCTLLAIVFEAIGWGTQVKIMPLGDSITNGQYGSEAGGYRIQLYQLLTGNGDNFDFVGAYQNGPGTLPDKDHQGFNGWSIRVNNDPKTQAYFQIPGILNTYQPDVILMLLGTNDFYSDYFYDYSNDDFLNRYSKMIDTICATRPGARLLCASLTYRKIAWCAARQLEFNKYLPQLIHQKFVEGKNVFFVDLDRVIDSTTDLNDGVHFSVSGDTHAAQLWSDALRSSLKAETGLYGEYFNTADFTDLVMTRVDNTVNFDWLDQSPTMSSHAIENTDFSARFSGYVVPAFSETYSFYTQVNGGVRFYVNDQLLVDKWTDPGTAQEWSGTIALTAGQKYIIRMEYLKNTGTASAKLLWSSASVAKQIIPAACFSINGVNRNYTGYPSCSISIPSSDTLLSAPQPSLAMTAHPVQVGGGTISSVKFFREDTVLLGNGVQSSQDWRLTWNSIGTSVSNVRAHAIDNFNHVFITKKRRITVTALPLNSPENPTINLANGINYKYYEGTWDSLPDFSLLTPVKTGVLSSINVYYAARSSLFGYEFSGYLKVPFDDIYTLYDSSDAGSAVYLNNEKIINNDGVHSAREDSVTLALHAGFYSFKVRYFEKTGLAVLGIKWKSGTFSKAFIPAVDLFHPAEVPVVPRAHSLRPQGSRVLRTNNGWLVSNFDKSIQTINVFDCFGRIVSTFNCTGNEAGFFPDVKPLKGAFVVVLKSAGQSTATTIVVY